MLVIYYVIGKLTDSGSIFAPKSGLVGDKISKNYRKEERGFGMIRDNFTQTLKNDRRIYGEGTLD